MEEKIIQLQVRDNEYYNYLMFSFFFQIRDPPSWIRRSSDMKSREGEIININICYISIRLQNFLENIYQKSNIILQGLIILGSFYPSEMPN